MTVIIFVEPIRMKLEATCGGGTRSGVPRRGRRGLRSRRVAHRKDHAGQKGLDRLVERQNPAQAFLFDKREHGLVPEALHHAQLQAHAQQPTRDQRSVLLDVLWADDRHDERLAEAIDAVARRADGLERLRIVIDDIKADFEQALAVLT